MSSQHNLPFAMHGAAFERKSSTASETIIIDRYGEVVNLSTAAAETRTLANPTQAGILMSLHFQTDGGDCTVTFSTAFNEIGATVIVFTEVGQQAFFQSCQTAAGAFFWRKIADWNTGNSPADLAEIVITTNTITAAESGKTFYLSLVGGFTSTLPVPALGLYFRFIVAVAPTTAYIITTNAGANILFGMMEERAGGAGVAGAAQDTFNFVASQAIIADWVEFWSDGTNWHYHGMVNVAAGNTVSVT